ncbi:sushi, von Willebrand factor type A, EGF and pentraxin domain-containing protein 1-like isoform X2 [Corticium candelabrum]|uniref:sushi, von Willebrand factor type A, EGF and pentraxin domain-containing protein 1-like isoform X2 n=1 Tax=Corticium candelabrum TaxID=121492 RepID=UPI002E25DA5F|nr:sushi, von Willebrand factor type A, EGF and pentraxin domain-containing protein 1-like isoform X2 [Corticium candelabrum]
MGSLASFQCNLGYNMTGSPTSICQLVGTQLQWSDKTPNCTVIKCPSLSHPLNGYLLRHDVSYNTTVSFGCNPGYRLKKHWTITCLISGQWSGASPHCELAKCLVPRPPLNGQALYNSTRFGSLVLFQCNSGYKLVGSTTSSCKLQGSQLQWSRQPPTCQLIVCPTLSGPMNGWLSISDVGNSKLVTYNCNPGYHLKNGSATRYCLVSGEWNGTAPACEVGVCSVPTFPVNGVVEFKSTDMGSLASFQCNLGYNMTGSPTSICQLIGTQLQWSDKTPNCTVIKCPSLSHPLNGYLLRHDVSYNTTVSFGCNPGYRLKKHWTITCLISGQWSGASPHCELAKCLVPRPPLNGQALYNSTRFGSLVLFQCNSGYKLVGSTTSSCKLRGSQLQWSRQLPTCQLIVCPTLSGPMNGWLSISDVGNSKLVTYNCNPGYHLKNGNVTRYCLISGAWNGTAPSCEETVCPILIRPLDGVIKFHNTKLGSSASFQCNVGYNMSGSARVTCQLHELKVQWSDKPPVCHLIRCPSLFRPRNGYISSNEFTYNKSVNYGCNPGYRLSLEKGSKTRTCLISGQWSGRPPYCQPLKCSKLMDPLNGRVLYSSRKLHSSALFECSSGYRLDGSRTVNCRLNGSLLQWSNQLPTCQAIRCSSLSPPVNGSLSGSKFSYNKSVVYSCNRGYNLENGNKIRTCLMSGHWSGKAPSCQRAACPALFNPVNGIVQYIGTNSRSTALFHCHVGYKLIGSTVLTCVLRRSHLQWSNQPPTCRKIQCPKLHSLVNGYLSSSNDSYNASVTYMCNSGYHIRNGDQTRTCLSTGRWSGRVPYCERVAKCLVPRPPLNGQALYNSTMFGSLVLFQCNSGYKLVGSTTSSCKLRGSQLQWSRQPPTCQLIVCPTLSGPMNGWLSISDVGNSKLVTYNCNPGYHLKNGSATRYCLVSGEWNGTAPACEETVCPILIRPLDGVIKFHNTKLGSSASFQCNVGYNMSGSARVTCQLHGLKVQWSDEPPVCHLIRCPSLFRPRNGYISSNEFTYNKSVNYGCNPGYRLSLEKGSKTRTCLISGQWSGRPPYCQPLKCSKLLNPLNGRVLYSSRKLHSSALFECSSGYRLDGSGTVNCRLNGSLLQWSNQLPTCQAIRCSSLSPPVNGSLSGSKFSYNKSVVYSCNRGYNLENGNKIRTCLMSGHWSGKAPSCQRAACPALFNPVNGIVQYIGTNSRSTALFHCHVGYKLIGSTVLTCVLRRSHLQWSNQPPTCRKIQCPKLHSLVNGYLSSSNDSYNASVTYMCNSGYHIRNGDQTRTCLSTGLWSGRVPYCERGFCPRPKNVVNGTVHFNSTRLGARALFRCKAGYKLVGRKIVICQANGARLDWSDPPPTCLLITCPVLFRPVNGDFSGTGNHYRQSVTYSCKPGYHLVSGSKRRNCLISGQWSGTAPFCLGHICVPMSELTNLTTPYNITDNPVQTFLSTQCEKGHESKRIVVPICPENSSKEQWLHLPSSCQRKRCPTPVALLNGSMFGDNFTYDSSITYQCNREYQLTFGNKRRKCLSTGQWSGFTPYCQHKCSVLGNCRLTEECKVNSSGHAVCKCIPIDLCPSNHEPVCGTDAETYQNECRLRVKSCHAGRHDIDIAGHDNCGFGGICNLDRPRPAPGSNCRRYSYRYWFNSTSQACEQYEHGPCFEGKHSFLSSGDCKTTCIKTDVCSLPFDAGKCNAANETRWFFNITTQRCESFQYGGCFGNENNFITETQCQKKCPKCVCSSSLNLRQATNQYDAVSVLRITSNRKENNGKITYNINIISICQLKKRVQISKKAKGTVLSVIESDKGGCVCPKLVKNKTYKVAVNRMKTSTSKKLFLRLPRQFYVKEASRC